MPRTKRLDLPGVVKHVVQRGNDRQPCFFREADYRRYLGNLHEAALKCGGAVHASVVVINDVHLLVTPVERCAIGRMMQAVRRRYVRCVNYELGRTGTLWDGRYKSSLVHSERYILACDRYNVLRPQ